MNLKSIMKENKKSSKIRINSKQVFVPKMTLPLKQQKQFKGTLTYATVLIVARTFFANLTISAQKKSERSHAHVITRFAKMLILEVYRFALFPTRRFTSHSPRNRLIFTRYIFIRPFLFISLRSAPDRDTNRNASKRRRGRGGGREKLCRVYELGGGGEVTGGRGSNRENSGERRNAQGNDKKPGVRRGWEAKARRAATPRRAAQKAQKTIRLSARWDRDVTSNRRRERTSEAARRSAALGLRKFGWSSVGSFQAFPRVARKSSWPPLTTNRRQGLMGGTDEVTRITEIRRLHSEWNSDGSGSPRKFAAVRRAMEWENFLSWFRLKKTFVRTVILR